MPSREFWSCKWWLSHPLARASSPSVCQRYSMRRWPQHSRPKAKFYETPTFSSRRRVCMRANAVAPSWARLRSLGGNRRHLFQERWLRVPRVRWCVWGEVIAPKCRGCLGRRWVLRCVRVIWLRINRQDNDSKLNAYRRFRNLWLYCVHRLAKQGFRRPKSLPTQGAHLALPIV